MPRERLVYLFRLSLKSPVQSNRLRFLRHQLFPDTHYQSTGPLTTRGDSSLGARETCISSQYTYQEPNLRLAVTPARRADPTLATKSQNRSIAPRERWALSAAVMPFRAHFSFSIFAHFHRTSSANALCAIAVSPGGRH